MNRPSNKTIISEYLDLKESKNTRKSALNYFFNEEYFGYDSHVFDIDTQILIKYFKYFFHTVIYRY
ncbi:MAG: hypothetical protein ACFFHD_16310 [Promethearchaeota archaeon]